jgi:hypothetical protein
MRVLRRALPRSKVIAKHSEAMMPNLQTNLSRSAPTVATRGTLTAEQFVAAGLANLTQSCRQQWWPARALGTADHMALPLWAAAPSVVDTITALQRRLGLPVTGILDDATMAAFRRHAAANTPTGLLIRENFIRAAPKDSIQVRFCGGRADRRGDWGATSAEIQQARTEASRIQRDFPGSFRRDDTRNTIAVLGERQRTGNGGTEVFGLTYGKLLQAALWNSYVAALSPTKTTIYPVPANSKLNLRTRRDVPRPYSAIGSVSSPSLAMWIGQWQLTKGRDPVGLFTPEVAKEVKLEMAAGTDFGRRFAALIAFEGAEPTAAQVQQRIAADRTAAQRGTRSAGVVSNLLPQLTTAQATATEQQRRAGQVVRDQYGRASTQATTDKMVKAAKNQKTVDALAAQGRLRTAATGGRTGFISPVIARSFVNPTLDYGDGLVSTRNTGTGVTTQGTPSDDGEPEATSLTTTTSTQSGTPGTTATTSSGGSRSADPTPFVASDGAWSSASAEDIAAAQKGDDEDAWAFDPSGALPPGAEVPLDAGQPDIDDMGGAVDAGGAVGPAAVIAPVKKASKGGKVLLGLGVLVGAYFLLRNEVG